ncbi:MAG: SprT family zinc-dependent metalloprotease [Pseudomonadota bacterium]|nr:SprT family zinc-dependent metalloprotease [Pseudomonadota bacterium]
MKLRYKLIRSAARGKTLSLTVKPDGELVIRAPRHAPLGEIEDFFLRKRAWIERKLAELESQPRTARHDSLTAGSQVPFLGVYYPVALSAAADGRGGLSFDGERFLLAPVAAESGRELLASWYRREAASLLPARVAHFEGIWGCRARSVRISEARSRWGSCSADNRLAFSWRLMMAPSAVIDYVVVHELAHLREKNHSPRFWALVGELCPDYEQRRRWLKTAGRDLFS